MVRRPSIEWERVLGQASKQFILPAMAAALRDLDLIGSLDGELGAFLLAVHAANLERNDELRDELAAAVALLNRAGIEPVLLKGAIRLVDQLYPDHGWRMLRDLDLLVPQAKFAEAIRALEDAGYAPNSRSGNELRHPGGSVQIDLHKELFSTARQVRLLPAAEMLEGSRPAAFGDGTVRLPAIEHQLAHLIGHSQIKHSGHALGRIALRDRLEAAALMRWAAESVDWQALSLRFAAVGYRRPLIAFALSLNDGALCAVPVPARVDALTALQQRWIAIQARSRNVARLSFWPIWCVAMLRMQIEEREAGRPKMVRTLERLIFERGAGRRMFRTLVHGIPRPW